MLFEDQGIPSYIVANMAEVQVKAFSSNPKAKWVHQVGELVVDKSIEWVFFNGVCQALEWIYGLGFILHCSKALSFHFKSNACTVTDNKVEIVTFVFLLKFSRSK